MKNAINFFLLVIKWLKNTYFERKKEKLKKKWKKKKEKEKKKKGKKNLKKCYKYTKERLQEQAQNGYRSLSEAEKDKKK